MNSYLNDFSALQMRGEPIQISTFDLHIIFANEEQEILYRREDFERGCTKAQHRLGALLMFQKNNINALYEAYKWLFIAVALEAMKMLEMILVKLTLFLVWTKLMLDLIWQWNGLVKNLTTLLKDKKKNGPWNS